MRWDARDHAAVAAVLAVCLAAFHRQLSYWFTGPDTFSLIRSSQIQAPSDLWRILTEPLMAGTGFTELATFYRPVTHLTFSLDWFLWGLDPTGYHATNILLHATATVLVYVLARRLTGGRVRAVVAASFFTLHPVVAESVPAISRRQDALATVFLLGSLLTYLRARRGGDRSRAWWAASLVLALGAFGSKEVAIVLPGVILAHAWIVDRDAPGGFASLDRARWAIQRALPHIVVAGAFAAWRTAVLGGLGGYPDRVGIASRWVAWEVGEYLTALVAPLRYVVVLLGLTGTELVILVGGLAVASALGVVVLYRGKGSRFVADLRNVWATPTGRASVFCLVWILGGGILFTGARTFDDWSAYQFVIPFVIATASLLVGGLAALRRGDADDGDSPVVGNRATVTAGTGLIAGTIAITLVFSPAVHGADAWKTNGEVQRAVLVPLAASVEATDSDVTEIRAHDLAWEDRTHGQRLPQVHTVYYFQAFTLEDWLALRSDAGSTPEVTVESGTALEETPWGVTAEFEPDEDGGADLYLDYESTPRS